jgi:response regulator RpfG family c-di-GMP phosphodiesterase
MNHPLTPTNRILFVDDEPNILDAFRRQFYNRFPLDTAVGAEQGLELLTKGGPYAVIVSDLRMPGMNGIQFLAEAKKLSPSSVRIMLTGYADTAAAIGAVNQGNIFRFLNKPCVGEVLGKTIEAGLEQCRLQVAEHVLLEQTLRGCVQVLTEILSLSSPETFSQTQRIRDIVHHIAGHLPGSDSWQFEVAAMLSLIGCIAVPPVILAKVAANETLSEAEQRVFDSHPSVGHSLLAKIPRLEQMAQMVHRQHEVCRDPGETVSDNVVIGARMLKAAMDLDFFQMAGVPLAEAIAKMRARGIYNLRVLNILEGFHLNTAGEELADLYIRELVPGMTVDQDVMALNGLLLLARGQTVTPAVVARLESYRDTQGLLEPIRVHLMPS